MTWRKYTPPAPVRKRPTPAQLSQAWFRALHFASLPKAAVSIPLRLVASQHPQPEPLAPLRPSGPAKPIDWKLPTKRRAA